MPGQTKQEIRRLLDEADLAPQYRYGQNFLIDLNLMRKLVDAAELSPADTVLEVGPGTGSLTEFLLDAGCQVVAVEIDRGLQRILRDRFAALDRFTLVQGDILAAKSDVNPLVLRLLRERPPGPGGVYKLVANLPYQVATPLLVDLLLAEPRVDRIVCTIQKEVGERLVAPPNTEAYGPVSVVLQILARLEPLAILPPQVFWPRPKVESIMIRAAPLPRHEVSLERPPDFVAFVRAGFQQRRKMLRRLLRDRGPVELAATFQRAGVDPDRRPGELPPEAWVRLYRAVRRIEA